MATIYTIGDSMSNGLANALIAQGVRVVPRGIDNTGLRPGNSDKLLANIRALSRTARTGDTILYHVGHNDLGSAGDAKYRAVFEQTLRDLKANGARVVVIAPALFTGPRAHENKNVIALQNLYSRVANEAGVEYRDFSNEGFMKDAKLRSDNVHWRDATQFAGLVKSTLGLDGVNPHRHIADSNNPTGLVPPASIPNQNSARYNDRIAPAPPMQGDHQKKNQKNLAAAPKQEVVSPVVVLQTQNDTPPAPPQVRQRRPDF